MSALIRSGHQSARKSVVMGHSRHFASQKNSDLFRRRSTVKSVTDLPIERDILPHIAAGMIPLGTGSKW